MTEYRFWLRERGRSRNKWHVSTWFHPGAVAAQDRELVGPMDVSACGVVFQGIETATHETQELPNGTLPTDAHGTCLHCLRWMEVNYRKEEAEDRREKRNADVDRIVSGLRGGIEQARKMYAE